MLHGSEKKYSEPKFKYPYLPGRAPSRRGLLALSYAMLPCPMLPWPACSAISSASEMEPREAGLQRPPTGPHVSAYSQCEPCARPAMRAPPPGRARPPLTFHRRPACLVRTSVHSTARMGNARLAANRCLSVRVGACRRPPPPPCRHVCMCFLLAQYLGMHVRCARRACACPAKCHIGTYLPASWLACEPRRSCLALAAPCVFDGATGCD